MKAFHLFALSTIMAIVMGRRHLRSTFKIRQAIQDETVVKREAKDSASFLTYNMGLSPPIKEYFTRREYLADFASKLDCDVVCLQEVWYIRDMKEIMENAHAYKHSYSMYHSSSGKLKDDAERRPCASLYDFLRGLYCFRSYCNLERDDEKLACSRDRCGLLDLGQECASCLIMSEGSTSEGALCLTSYRSTNTVGLLILSKVEMSNPRAEMFMPGVTQFLPRGHVDVEISGIGSVSCTHLTSQFDGIYNGPPAYTSYKEQQTGEIRSLTGNNYDVIMGDLNTGPMNADYHIDGEFPDNYQRFLDSGYISPAQAIHECTWCSSNRLLDTTKRVFIDHILVGTDRTTSDAKLKYTENIPGHNFPMSDHYGLELLHVYGHTNGTIKTVTRIKEVSVWQKIKDWLCFFC